MFLFKWWLPKNFFKFSCLIILFSCLYFPPIPQANGGQNQWSNIGLGERTINALLIDPVDPKRLYAGTTSGGVV